MTHWLVVANNPGAVRPIPGSAEWTGSVGTVANSASGTFVQFDTMASGLRAILRNLHTYGLRHGLTTPEQIINRWAPPSDNNPTRAYSAEVARRVGVQPNESIPQTYASRRALLLAIVSIETGGWQPIEADIAAAFRRMANEEAARGRDPSQYRSGSMIEDARRVPERSPGATGIVAGGGAVALVWGWLQGSLDALASVGVYGRDVLAALSRLDIPGGQAAGAALLALAVLGAAYLVVKKEKTNDTIDADNFAGWRDSDHGRGPVGLPSIADVAGPRDGVVRAPASAPWWSNPGN